MAAVLSLGLAVSDIAWAVPSPGSVRQSSASASGSARDLPFRWTPDPAAGWIEDHHLAGPDARTVILVQDAHANPSAQFNAARIIQSALDASGSDLIFLEAGQGDLDLDTFRKIGTGSERRAAGASLVRKGRLQAAEYLQLTSTGNIRLLGAENRAAYERALSFYREVFKLRSQTLQSVARMEQTLFALGPGAFGPDVEEVWKLRTAHRSGALGAAEYADELVRRLDRTGESVFAYSNLKTLSKLKTKESRISFRRVAKNLARLSPDRPWEELTDEQLMAGIKKHSRSFSASESAEVRRYLDYRKQLSKLDAAQVLRETDAAEERLLRSVSMGDPAAARWLAAALHIEFIRQLLRLEADSTSVERSLGAFGTGPGPDRLAAALLNRSILELERHDDRVLTEDPALERAVRLAHGFYRLAERRDVFLAGQTVRGMRRHDRTSAVLVAGGYHASNLKRIFKTRGVSYVSVIPKTDAPSDRTRYERFLTGTDGSAISLPPAGARSGFSRETRELLRAALLPGQVSSDGARMAKALPPADGQRSGWREDLSTLLDIAINRLRLEWAVLKFRAGGLDLPELLRATLAYHRQTGFVKDLPAGSGEVQRVGDYAVALYDVARKTAGAAGIRSGSSIRRRVDDWKRRWFLRLEPLHRAIASLRGERHDAECRLCMHQWPSSERPIRIGKELFSPNPFPLVGAPYTNFVVHSVVHGPLEMLPTADDPKTVSTAHRRLEQMLDTARKLYEPDQERPLVAFANHRDVGASIAGHHHYQVTDAPYAVLDRTRLHLVEFQPQTLGSAAVFRVANYPGQPVMVRSRDRRQVAALISRIGLELESSRIPAGLVARWDPEQGFEAYLFPYRTFGRAHHMGTVQAAGLLVLARTSPRPEGWKDPAEPDPNGSGLAPWELEVPLNGGQAAGILRDRLLLDADALTEVLGRALDDPAGARMAASKARVQAEAYLGRVTDEAPDTRSDDAWIEFIAAEWKAFKTGIWSDVPARNYPEVAEIYARAALRTSQMIYERSIRTVSNGSGTVEQELRTAALAATGSFGRAQMTFKSDADHYWILPDAGYEDTPGGMTPKANLLRLIQVYRVRHDQVFEGKRFKPSYVPLVPTRRASDVAASVAALIESDALEVTPRDFEMMVRVSESSDAVLIGGNETLLMTEKRSLSERLNTHTFSSGKGVRQLIRKAILIRDAEYRSVIQTPGSFGGAREWSRLQWLLDLDQRSWKPRHLPEWFARFLSGVQGGWTGISWTRDAFWRQLRRRDSGSPDPQDRREVIEFARDSAGLLDESIRAMRRLWREVRLPSDPASLQIFLASGEVDETFLRGRLMELRRRSDQEAVLEIGPASPDGLTELVIAWPEDRPGLLGDLSGLLIAHRLETVSARVRTIHGRPFNRFWVRGWPSDPAAAEKARFVLGSDLRDLRSRTITIPGVFARQGRPYTFSRSAIPDDLSPVVWAEGGEIHLLAREFYPADDTDSRQSSLFHMVSRWLGLNGMDIVRTTAYRSQRGDVLASWTVRDAEGRDLSAAEAAEIGRLIEQFIRRSTVEPWDFVPAAALAYDRWSSDLAKLDRSADRIEDIEEAWRKFAVAVWGATPTVELKSRLDDMDMRLRMHAAGVRALALDIFQRLIKKPQYRPLDKKLDLAQTLELTQATLLPGRRAHFLVAPADPLDLGRQEFERLAGDFMTELDGTLNRVLKPRPGEVKTAGWIGGASVRLVSASDLAAAGPEGLGEWSDPSALAVSDNAWVRLMEYAEASLLTPRQRSPLVIFRNKLLRALADPRPDSWGARVLVAAWQANFDSDIAKPISRGFDGVHALQMTDLRPLLRYGRRLRLLTLPMTGPHVEPARDAEVQLLAFQHRMWLLRQVVEPSSDQEVAENPEIAKFADIYGLNFDQAAREGIEDGAIPRAEMESLRRKGLRDYVRGSMRPTDRSRLGIHPDQATDLASDALITHPLYRSARTVFEVSAGYLSGRGSVRAPAASSPDISGPEKELLEAGLIRTTVRGYLSIEKGWVEGEREEIAAADSVKLEALRIQWTEAPEDMLRVIRLAAAAGLPVSENVLDQMRVVTRYFGKSLEKKWTSPGPGEEKTAASAASEFRAILELEVPVDGAMVELYRTGLLSAVLPELGGAEHMGDKLQFHYHLPIWHTLRVFRKIEHPEQIYPEESDPDSPGLSRGMNGPIAGLVEDYKKSVDESGLTPLLRLAVLLHDAAKPGWRFKRGATHDEIVSHQLIPAAQKRLGMDRPEYAVWLSFFDLEIPKVIARIPMLDSDEETGRPLISRQFRALIHSMMRQPDPQSGGRRIVENLRDRVLNKAGRPLTEAQALAGMLLFISADESDTSFATIRNYARQLGVAWELLTKESADTDPLENMRRELIPEVARQVTPELRERILAEAAGQSNAVEDAVAAFLAGTDPSLWNRERPKAVASYFALHHDALKEGTVRVMVPGKPSRRTTVTVAVPGDVPGIYAVITGVLSAYADIQSSHAHAVGRDGQQTVFDRFEIVWRDGTGPVDAQTILGRDLTAALEAASRSGTDAFERTMRDIYRNVGSQLDPASTPDRAGREYEFVPNTGEDVTVHFEPLETGRYRVDVDVSDFPGLLHTVSYALWRLMGFDVESAAVATAVSRSLDSFYVRTPSGVPLRPETIRLYEESLRIFLSLKLIQPAHLRQIFDVVRQVVDARENHITHLRQAIERSNAGKTTGRVDPEKVIRHYGRVAAGTARIIRDALKSPEGLDGVLIDGPSGIGKTTFIRFLEDELQKLGLDPSVLPLDLFMRPTQERDQVKSEMLSELGKDQAFSATDESSRIWREEGPHGVREFLNKLFERWSSRSGAPQPSLLIPSAYVRSVKELDYSLFTEVQNYPRLAGIQDRASADLLIPVRPGRVLLLDGKYAHNWIPSERRILTVRLDGDEARILAQFEARTQELKDKDGRSDTHRIGQTLAYMKSFLWPSWVEYRKRTDPQVHVRVDLSHVSAAHWKVVEQQRLDASGARLAEPGSVPAVTTDQAARFAVRVLRRAPRASLPEGTGLFVWDPAGSGPASLSRLSVGTSGRAFWNDQFLPLPAEKEVFDVPADASATDLRQELDRQLKSMDAVTLPGGSASPVAVHLNGLSHHGRTRTPRLLSLARDLAAESRQDPSFAIYLESDLSGSFRSLLVREGFVGIFGTGPVPSAATHLITVSDLKALRSRPEGLPAGFRAVTVEDVIDELPGAPEVAGRSGTEAVYAFRPLIRLASVLRGRDLSDLAADYRRMTGRTIPIAEMERLIAGDLDTAERWAFKPLRALLSQALSLYASAARMAAHSA